MSTISTSLNYLLASNFSELGRAQTGTGPLNGAGNVSARDLRAALGNLPSGTNVSARTDYTVTANGTLVPRATSITVGSTAGADALDRTDGKLGAGFYTAPTELPRLTFGDLQRPRATLSPSDEAELFDTDTVGGDVGQGSGYLQRDSAEDENGDTVEVEIITPDDLLGANIAQGANLSAQRQQNASGLYARTYALGTEEPALLAFAA
ncbi:MAG: hypothetical protein DI582_10260 [Azospirillum brasilense]|nr:MAG: hypothetical protein DI582_10260 [Azospirillum brasilense]